MRKTMMVAVVVALAGTASAAAAQATGMPSYNAPYRAFAKSEFGGVISFPNGGGTAFEGMYRFATGTLDIGVRGGAFFPGGGGNNVVLAGAEGRARVLTHNEQFPLDGAFVAGVGGQFVSGASVLVIPAGLSLGRRLDVQGSQVSIIPYVQPTLALTSSSGPFGSTKVRFVLGLGGDFRLTKMFDARVGVGVGDAALEGFSLAAVWVH